MSILQFSMVPNRNGGDGQFDRVDLVIPASAFMQMAATLWTRRPGWKLNNVGEKEMFAADAGVPMAGRTPRRMCFTESYAEARNVVRSNSLFSTDRSVHASSLV